LGLTSFPEAFSDLLNAVSFSFILLIGSYFGVGYTLSHTHTHDLCLSLSNKHTHKKTNAGFEERRQIIAVLFFQTFVLS